MQPPCTTFFNVYIVAMLKKETLGYGYERGDRSFKGHGCDIIFIDTRQTRRERRRDLMQRLREGSTVKIFSWKELAPGALKATMQAQLDGMGVEVVVLDIPLKPTVTPSQRGVSDAAKAEALTMWHEPTKFSVEYIQNHLARKGLGTYTRNQLNYALGARTAPPTDAPVEVGK